MSAQVLVLTKACTKCGVVKALDEFYFRASRQQHHAACKSCQCEASLEWKQANPERRRAYHLAWQRRNMDKMIASTESWRKRNPEKQAANARRYSLRRFGITPEQYDEMLIAQSFSCAICERHQSEFKKRLAVDHDHETGKVRGLLCDNCNKGIGCLQEDPAIFASATAYLQAHE